MKTNLCKNKCSSTISGKYTSDSFVFWDLHNHGLCFRNSNNWFFAFFLVLSWLSCRDMEVCVVFYFDFSSILLLLVYLLDCVIYMNSFHWADSSNIIKVANSKQDSAARQQSNSCGWEVGFAVSKCTSSRQFPGWWIKWWYWWSEYVPPRSGKEREVSCVKLISAVIGCCLNLLFNEVHCFLEYQWNQMSREEWYFLMSGPHGLK